MGAPICCWWCNNKQSLFNTITNNHLLGIKAISSWEYPGHFSQSYSNFFYPKRNLETNRKSQKKSSLFHIFYFKCAKNKFVVRNNSAYFFSQYMWESVFLFKILVGQRISFQNTCGRAYFFSKYMWDSVFIFKILVGQRISFQNTCGRAYFFSKYMWDSVFIFKILVGQRISFQNTCGRAYFFFSYLKLLNPVRSGFLWWKFLSCLLVLAKEKICSRRWSKILCKIRKRKKKLHTFYISVPETFWRWLLTVLWKHFISKDFEAMFCLLWRNLFLRTILMFLQIHRNFKIVLIYTILLKMQWLWLNHSSEYICIYIFRTLLYIYTRGVSDVGFSIFADTDADFAF